MVVPLVPFFFLVSCIKLILRPFKNLYPEASRLAVEKELERIKAEKAEKERVVQEELKSLAKKLEELQLPWYKKWFSWRQPEDDPSVFR